MTLLEQAETTAEGASKLVQVPTQELKTVSATSAQLAQDAGAVQRPSHQHLTPAHQHLTPAHQRHTPASIKQISTSCVSHSKLSN